MNNGADDSRDPWRVCADPRPLVLVLSGPSGAGKSSLIKGLLAQRQDLVASVSATTRSPRGTERDGVDYHFLSEDEFAALREEDGLLECAQVFGRHWYGTPRAFVERQHAAGRHVIMDLDVQGAVQLRARMQAAAVLVFVLPPDATTLEARLRGRGTDSEDVIARRLAEAEREIAQWQCYDYLLCNDALDDCVDALAAVLRAESQRIVDRRS